MVEAKESGVTESMVQTDEQKNREMRHAMSETKGRISAKGGRGVCKPNSTELYARCEPRTICVRRKKATASCGKVRCSDYSQRARRQTDAWNDKRTTEDRKKECRNIGLCRSVRMNIKGNSDE